MADWVACTTPGENGKVVAINLDAAYLIAPCNLGSAISFLVSENGEEGSQPVTHVVTESLDEIMKKFKVRPSA